MLVSIYVGRQVRELGSSANDERLSQPLVLL